MRSALRLDRLQETSTFFLPVDALFNFLFSQLCMQNGQGLLWVPVLLSVGIGGYFVLAFEPPLALSVVLFCFLLSCYVLFRHKAIAFIAVIVVGFFAANLRTTIVNSPMIERKTGPVDIIGTVESIEKLEQGGGSRVVLRDLNIEKFAAEETPKKIRLRLRADGGIHTGQRIKALGNLTPQSSPLYPGGFDFRRYMFFKQIGAVGFIYNEPEIIDDDAQFSFVQTMREAIAQKIVSTLPVDQSSIALALLIGQKTSISQNDRDAIKAAGLAHMLAISGLHIGIFSGTIFFVIRLFLSMNERIALRYSTKKIAAVFAFCGAVFYMLIAGATIPTQRAVIMSGVVFLAIILDRSPISLRLVAFAAMALLVISPESLMSASFQMSFSAVTCLVFFYSITRRYWIESYRQGHAMRKAALYFIGVCSTTVIASIATAPFAIYHFGQVSFFGSVANLIAVPLLAFIVMPFALLSLILMPLGLHAVALHIMGSGINLILQISYWAAELPFAILQAPSWNLLSFVLFVCGGLWIILWNGWGRTVSLLFFALSFISVDDKRPFMLVSASHKLVSVYHGDKLYVTNGRSEKFVRKNWEEYYGLEQGSAKFLAMKGAHKKPDGTFENCDEAGCRFVKDGYKFSYLKDPYHQKEECHWADLLITDGPLFAKNCDRPFVIDKFSTWRGGAHAVYVSSDGITIKTVSERIGARPWTRAIDE